MNVDVQMWKRTFNWLVIARVTPKHGFAFFGTVYSPLEKFRLTVNCLINLLVNAAQMIHYHFEIST